MAHDHGHGTGGNLAMVGKLVVVAVLMFGFGFAMVPIYQKICEVTGINFLTRPDEQQVQAASLGKVDKSRLVTIEFDANSRGAWGFKPEVRSLTAHPGELVTVTYEIANNLPRKVSGQAIPSYAPQLAVKYFNKIEPTMIDQMAALLYRAGNQRRSLNSVVQFLGPAKSLVYTPRWKPVGPSRKAQWRRRSRHPRRRHRRRRAQRWRRRRRPRGWRRR